MKVSSKLKGTRSLLALTLLLTGCGARAYEGGGDSNSNWLKSCDPNAECGSGLECLCGICTMQCASNRACGDDEATCDVPVGCELAVAVCTPRDKSETDSDTVDTRGMDGGKATDTIDNPQGNTETDTTIVDTVSDTTTGEGRVDDSEDTNTGETVDTSDTTLGENMYPTDSTGTATANGTAATTGPGTVAAPTSPTSTDPGTNPTTSGTTTTFTGSTTGTTANTGTLREEIGDPQCGTGACVDGNLCFSPDGRRCECSVPSELSSCEGLLFQTLALPDTLQSCVARAVSGDGVFVVGMCQVVDRGNLAVLWGPDGVRLISSTEVELTQGLGITDDGLTSYWLGSDGRTVAQTNDVQSFLLGNAAEAFTPDGSLAVGRLGNDTGGATAFRWTEVTGTELLQVLYQNEAPNDAATAVSADGQTTVGYANAVYVQVPVRWNASGEIAELPLLDGVVSGQANDVSADGSVIVGGSGDGHALRWTSSGVELLLQMDDTTNQAKLVTRDGTRVFGNSSNGAWMWDEASGVQSLEAVLGMDESWTITNVADVSADGTTIVGSVQLANDFSPWRWFAFRGRLPTP